MARTVMTNEHLSKIIDACIEDLAAGGSKLFDLAQLFSCLAQYTENESFGASMPVIASYGGEIVSFRPFVSLPILPDETRRKYQELFKEALESGKKALSVLKEELCSKDRPDFAHIIKALALLSKHDYALSMARQVLLRSRPPLESQQE